MSYGAIPNVGPNVPIGSSPSPRNTTTSSRTVRDYLYKLLESNIVHWTILFLVLIDFLTTLAVILITLYEPKKEGSVLTEFLLSIAFVINSIFVAEVVVKLFVFGQTYFYKGKHGILHGFDAFVILSTFILELVLRGKNREVIGLLVLLRLWRVVKVLGNVSVGVVEYDEAVEENETKKLRDALDQVSDVLKQISVDDRWDEGKKQRVFSIIEKAKVVV